MNRDLELLLQQYDEECASYWRKRKEYLDRLVAENKRLEAEREKQDAEFEAKTGVKLPVWGYHDIVPSYHEDTKEFYCCECSKREGHPVKYTIFLKKNPKYKPFFKSWQEYEPMYLNGIRYIENKPVCDTCYKFYMNRKKIIDDYYKQKQTEKEKEIELQKKKKQAQKKEKVKQFFHNLAVNIVHYLILGIIGLVFLVYFILWAMAVIGNAVGPLDDSVLTTPFRK